MDRRNGTYTVQPKHTMHQFGELPKLKQNKTKQWKNNYNRQALILIEKREASRNF